MVRWTAAVLVCLCLSVQAGAETKCWGWRGDGTGKFPEADPPVVWERISAVMKGMSAQAARPKGKDAEGAAAVRYGTFDEWLILGPVDAPVNADDAAAPGRSAPGPDAGDPVGDLKWQTVRASGALLDFNALLAEKSLSGKVVYAHTYFCSKTGGTLLLRMKGTPFKVWLNGKELVLERRRTHASHPFVQTVKPQQGWNRLLVRAAASTKRSAGGAEPGTAVFQLVMHGDESPDRAETSGVVWAVQPPQAYRMSCAQPLIVGDRVIVNSDPEFLVCYRKSDGKFLWVTYNGFYEVATEEERHKHPDLFKEMDPAARRLKELAATYTGTLEEKQELDRLVRKLPELMFKVDRVKYRWVARRQEAGVSGLTSCSDGKHVYTWFAGGVSTCHDLDGNRKWITLENQQPYSRKSGYGSDLHGFQVSPFLAAGDFVVTMKGMMGLDKETGAVKWRLPGHKPRPAPDSAEPLGAEGHGNVEFYRLGLFKPGHGFFANSMATRDGALVYKHLRQGTRGGPMIEVYALPGKFDGTTKMRKRWVGLARVSRDTGGKTPGANWGISLAVANVLVHEGLIYHVTTNGILRVIDAETLEGVYERRLDVGTITHVYPYPHGSGVCASPTLGGKYVYLWGNGGTTLVIKPGRTYEVVAKNRIERLLPGRHDGAFIDVALPGHYPECTVSSPVFEGRRIYYRAEEYLYCIGKE